MALDFPSAPTIGQTYTGANGTVWTWDGVKWTGGSSAAGSLITAQQIDYDPLRLTAVGTKLKALGTINFLNQPTGTINAALDGALNSYNGPATAITWNLPPGAQQYLTIALGSNSGVNTGTHTIVPAGSDLIFTPSYAGNYSHGNPLIIPALPKGLFNSITLMANGGGWLVVSVTPEIAEAMGWVSRPVFSGTESNSGVSFALVAGLWTRINLDFVATDTHGWWISNGYKPKRPGRYRIQWECHLGDTATGSGSVASVYAAIYLNGTLLDYRTINQFPGQALPAVNFCSVSALISYERHDRFRRALGSSLRHRIQFIWQPGPMSLISSYVGS